MQGRFIITEFVSGLIAKDKAGQRVAFADRHASAFIMTGHGKIRFSVGEVEYITDEHHALFLPKGLRYVNECLEDAESIVINFQTLPLCGHPISCAAIPYGEAMERYQTMMELSYVQSLQSDCLLQEHLYALSGRLFSADRKIDYPYSPLVHQALILMRTYCHYPEMNVAEIAKRCHISTVYLRKLFEREVGVSPHQKLVEIRMKQAKLLVKENRPVNEIARAVGYSDVFQFSRAYKSFYGCSPSKDRE